MKNYTILKKAKTLVGFLGVLMILLGFNAENANAVTRTVTTVAELKNAFGNLAKGDIIEIKAGDYYLGNSTLSLPSAFQTSTSTTLTTIRGYNGATPHIYGDLTIKGIGINLTGGDYITIKDLKLSLFCYCLTLVNATNITVDNIQVIDHSGHSSVTWDGIGIQLTNCSNCIVKNCIVTNNGGVNIGIWNSHDCQILNSKSYGTYASSHTYATDYYIVVEWSQNILVDGCTAQDMGGTNGIPSGKGNHGIGVKDNGTQGTQKASSSISIKNCKSTGFEECFFVAWPTAQYVTFENCIGDNRNKNTTWNSVFMVREGASNNTFKNCKGVSGNYYGGQVVTIYDYSECSGEQFENNNKFYNCSFTGSNPRLVFLLNAKNTLFENCNFYGGSKLFRFSKGISGAGNTGIVIKNSLITNVGGLFDIDLQGYIYNYGSSTKVAGYSDASKITTSYTNIYPTAFLSGTYNKNQNPLFVSSTDYHLQSTSPAINAGTIGTYAYDFDGIARPQGSAWDMGIYEYVGITPTLPTITTTAISAITQTTATSGGNVTSAGSSSVIARGVCWSTSSNPTTANSKTSNGTGIGSFTSSIAGLFANTTYYVRAYATNSVGTAYGTQVSFKTAESVPNTYYEDFNDGVANNFVASAGTWAVESNQYSQSSTTNSNTIASVPVNQVGKLVYQWTVNFISGSSAGMHIMCDASTSTNRGNSYLIFQTNTMLQIYESVGNALTKRKEASCTSAAGQSHTFLVIYDPVTGIINAYRDGSTTPIVSWKDDSPLTSGSYISLRTNSTHAHFDNLSVDYASYSEDFNDGVANNFVASSGTWAVESNQYSQSSTSNSNTIASVPVIQYGKLVYEWSVNFVSNTSAGMHIMCDASSSTNRGNSYLIFQTNSMLQIYESVGNSLTKRKEASCTSAAGQSHTYKVIYDPATGIINAYRDGSTNPIVSWKDDSPLISGSYISLRTNSTHAHFDDLSVKIYNNSTKSALENEDVETEIKTETEIMLSCYPNPFTSDLNISYSVPEDGDVLIQIYDFTGRVISKVVDEKQAAGSYNVAWNADERMTNGIYFCRIVANGFSKTSKIIML
ncbi:MAG: T9SS type A sorting domain-containing protein [Bacteroidales bacterium]|nr:T9SS type A sorting domain-containing protein [Bacteroidales bacterium]